MYPVIRAKNRNQVLEQKQRLLACGDTMEYLTFPGLMEIPCIEHLFSTRVGGVSEGVYSTLNFSITRGDNPASVLENYKRVGEVFEKGCDSFVATHQTHTTNIRIVTGEDAGKGVTRDRDYFDVDGLITKEKGLILSCFFADCVPLYFVDKKKQVIGLAHSGWRGTVAGMGACMVKRMQKEFGCEPENIQAAIGPSICQECYEVSEEVALRFQEGFWREDAVKGYCEQACQTKNYPRKEILLPGNAQGKYQLDLWLANLVVLRSAGIPLENISVTDVCTHCNSPYLFSHRTTGEKRGNLAAFLMLKE